MNRTCSAEQIKLYIHIVQAIESTPGGADINMIRNSKYLETSKTPSDYKLNSSIQDLLDNNVISSVGDRYVLNPIVPPNHEIELKGDRVTCCYCSRTFTGMGKLKSHLCRDHNVLSSRMYDQVTSHLKFETDVHTPGRRKLKAEGVEA